MIREPEDPPPLHPGLGSEQAFGRIVLPLTAEIDTKLAAVFASDDPAGPHKCRVALRRLTTVIDAFTPVLDKAMAAGFRRDAKAIFRLLGHQRDADVYLAGLADTRHARKVQAKTDAARDALRADLRRLRAVGLAPRLQQAIETGEIFRSTPKGMARRAVPVELHAARVLGKAWQLCLDHGKTLARMRGHAQHEFRKDMKTVRYLAEFFAPLWPDGGQERFLDRMQELQNALGHLNDLRNARARGRKLSVEAERQAAEALAEAQSGWTALRDAPLWWPQDADGSPSV